MEQFKLFEEFDMNEEEKTPEEIRLKYLASDKFCDDCYHTGVTDTLKEVVESLKTLKRFELYSSYDDVKSSPNKSGDWIEYDDIFDFIEKFNVSYEKKIKASYPIKKLKK